MTFETFCMNNFLPKSDREPFRDWLGKKAEGVKSYSEWWHLFQDYQIHLFKERGLKND